ncbi:hypothetical protein OIU84_028333 [Salix udensis]|uniref:Pectinesterase inhibitor domain-containing protein n=1 Tax=Salix udensis TaxID=889485 RepID=A0AAD6PA28_9ROSI|nr:hypothetical protein OIU84_028333 [Salix udensis]
MAISNSSSQFSLPTLTRHPAKMKNSLSLSFIFLSRPLFTATLLLIIHCIIVQSDANDLIAQTCKNTPYYNLCVSSLRSVPRSSRADVQGLALVMVDICEG